MHRLRKPSIAIVLGSAVMLTAVSAAAEPLSAVQQSAEHDALVTQRQVVDLLLDQAYAAFKSPARISHAGFTGKLPSNMEIVASRLMEAHALEPYRLDLLFSAASAHIANKDVDRAVQLYERILEAAPDDIDAHTYLATWRRFQGDRQGAETHMNALRELDPGRAADVERIFETVDRVVATPITATLDATPDGRTAILALGYALNPDGSMHETLIERLEKTLTLAEAVPDALVVTTGGVPQNNRTEAKLMADWLAARGVSRDRIVQDNYARSTVENVLNSRYVLTRHDIEHVVLVSSGSHVRRAQTLLDIATWQTGPHGLTVRSVAAPDKPLAELRTASEDELLGIYRDALKTYGLWSFRSYPLEER